MVRGVPAKDRTRILTKPLSNRGTVSLRPPRARGGERTGSHRCSVLSIPPAMRRAPRAPVHNMDGSDGFYLLWLWGWLNTHLLDHGEVAVSVVAGFGAECHELLAAPLAIAVLIELGQVLLCLLLGELLLSVGVLEAPTHGLDCMTSDFSPRLLLQTPERHMILTTSAISMNPELSSSNFSKACSEQTALRTTGHALPSPLASPF